jgi:hypothetical protein
MTDVLAPSGNVLRDAPACPYKGLESYTETDKDYSSLGTPSGT